MKTIHIISANPYDESFGHQLALAYQSAAIKAGHSVTLTHIVELDFDYNLLPDSVLEPDLKKEQEHLQNADHLVIVTPLWWNAYPACLKAYLDRMIVPGFAFKYPHSNPLLKNYLPKGLLKGTSARIINTQDSPALFIWLLGFPFSVGMRFAVLWFSGIWPVRRTRLASVRKANESKRQKWLNKVASLGEKAK
jgi:putative NADPH-quinone reductase